MRLLLPLLVAAAGIALTAPALAQPSAAHATAEEQFKQGREAMSRLDFKKALELLRASQAAEPGRGKLLNIALCEEQLGLYGSALKHFAEVGGQLAADDDRVTIVKQHVAAITPKVSHLKIQIAPGAAAGTTVKLDGEPLAPASLGAELAVDPGKHVVEASAAGAGEKRYEATVAPGELRVVQAAPAAPTGVEVAPPAAEPAPAPRGIAWPIGLAAVGVGGVALVVGVATGAAAAAKRSSTAKLCPTSSTCPASVQGDINAYDALGTASTASFVLGGVLAATGVVLVVTSRREAKAGPSGASSSWISPAFGPHSVGLGAQGVF